jgi:16S rRNA (uracil1498-N3)-methyltransferase
VVVKALRVAVEDLRAGEGELAGDAAHYVTRVHRLGPGAALSLFDPAGACEADATVVAVERGKLRYAVESLRPSPYRPHPIQLMQALAKGDKPERNIRDATALGVANIVLIESERSIVQLTPERAAARRARWQRIAVDVARQCGRGDLPHVSGPLAFAAALETAVAGRRLVLAPGARPLHAALGAWTPPEPLALLVGPEGGLSPSELEQARGAGFVAVSLGETVLRSELAAVAALGALVAWCER